MKQVANVQKEVCSQCNTVHAELSTCECGACLYASAQQLVEPVSDEDKEELNLPFVDAEDDLVVADIWPIYECKNCKARHFWD